MYMKNEQDTRRPSSGASRHLPPRGKAPGAGKAIRVIEYVHTADGELVRVDQLGPKQYEKFRRWLGCTYLNELYRGRAEFYYPETAGGHNG